MSRKRILLFELPFVADGPVRLRQSPEYQAKLRALRDGIVARHAGELAAENFLGRCRLRWRMALVYLRERRRLLPSPQALYVRSAHPNST